MKKQLPLFIGFLVGTIAVAEYFIPAKGIHDVHSFLLEMASVVVAAAVVLGAINVLQVNLPIIQRRRPDWPYKIVLLAGAVVMGIAGVAWHTFGASPRAGTMSRDAIPAATDGEARKGMLVVMANRDDAQAQVDGGQWTDIPPAGLSVTLEPGDHAVKTRVPRIGYSEYAETVGVAAGERVTLRSRLGMQWGTSGRVYTWLYDHVFVPCDATMFALLAFFIASAAFRAFRARNVEAALLLAAAIVVMVGRVPIGRALSSFMPQISDWIIDVPNNAGRRAIMIGAALGAIATGLRVILGLERSHLGRE
jgi:hypothetical protein